MRRDPCASVALVCAKVKDVSPMTQPDELSVPAKIPDELWHEINHLRQALPTFMHHARISVEAKELCTGEYEFDFYR